MEISAQFVAIRGRLVASSGPISSGRLVASSGHKQLKTHGLWLCACGATDNTPTIVDAWASGLAPVAPQTISNGRPTGGASTDRPLCATKMPLIHH